MLLSVFGRRLAARARWAAVAVYAALAGLVAAFDVDVLVGALTGDFAGIALVCGLLALAVSAAAHGLGHLGGPAGIVVAVLMLLLVGVSTAGRRRDLRVRAGLLRRRSRSSCRPGPP